MDLIRTRWMHSQHSKVDSLTIAAAQTLAQTPANEAQLDNGTCHAQHSWGMAAVQMSML